MSSGEPESGTRGHAPQRTRPRPGAIGRHCADGSNRRRGTLVEITTHGDVSNAPLATDRRNRRFRQRPARCAACRPDRSRRPLVSRTCRPLRHPGSLSPPFPAAGGPARRPLRPRRTDPGRATRREPGSAREPLGGSPRLRALGLGLDIVPIRGNVDTRLARVADGSLDGVVLARAGLARLGRLDEVTEVLDPLQMLPAPGQGALAVECRRSDDCRRSS